MATSATQATHSTMTTATRSNRFAAIAMANGPDKSSQPLGSTFPTTSTNSTWQTPGAKGIWGNGIGTFGKPREAVGSKDASDTFSKMPTGSSALAATSEAEPSWSRGGPWNSTEPNQGRNVSGNTSPNRSRIDAPAHEMNGNGAFYSSAAHQMQPAIGQRGPPRPKTGAGSDSTTSAFGMTQFPTYIGEKDDAGGFGQSKFNTESAGLNGFPAPKRSSQDGQYQSLVGGVSRDPAMPTTSHSETDLHASSNAFGDLGYGSHPRNGAHSQRPSMSYSQSGRGFPHGGLGQPLDHDELQAKFNDLSLGEGPGAPPSTMPNSLQSFGSGSGQTQFNPLTLPWGPAGQGFPAEFHKDMYPGSIGFEKRGSVADRGSPAGSSYRAGLSSPKSYTGTPQPPSDLWARPASRDPRNGPELDRRGHNPAFLQQSQQHGHNGQYYPGPYGYQPYPSFDPYATGYRVPMPMGPNYGVVPSYLAGAVAGPHSIRAGRDHDPARGMRSQLLDDFRQTSKSNKRFELKHIYGHIVEFSGDQHGSRFIQEKLETANSDEKDQVFQELQLNAVQLMKDVFGNYVIQKFFEHGNQVQKKVLAGAMKARVVDLSMQMYACRVVQKALEHVLVEQQAELVKELEPDILKVVKDQNGNHVVQKIIELVPRQHIEFIMNCFKTRVCELSTHSYGCRVIQRVMEYGADADKASIMAELQACAQQLIPDTYGNYVAQHVILKGSPEDRSRMIATVTKDLMHYSKHKYASNVVEKCIEKGSPEELRRIREAASVTGSTPDDLNSPLALLIKDQFGNYVIQKLLSQLKNRERQTLVDAIKPIVYPLKNVITGRPASAIDRLINAISTPQPVDSETSGSTAPTSPALPSDDTSVTTPPVLSNGHNSPSSRPSSTHDSAVGDVSAAAAADANAKLPV